jgi:hypothetical protein
MEIRSTTKTYLDRLLALLNQVGFKLISHDALDPEYLVLVSNDTKEDIAIHKQLEE